MAEIALDCPWCGTKHCAFTSVGEHSGGTFEKGHSRPLAKYEDRFVLLKCRRCRGGVVGQFQRNTSRTESRLHEISDDPAVVGWRLIRHFPREAVTDPCPDHVPDPIPRFYEQATANLRAENWDAAGTMFRKVLDVASKDLAKAELNEAEAAAAAGMFLKPRIDLLFEKGGDRLTPALKEWAGQIRLGGNEAAHDEEPFKKDQAETLHNFARLFLTYAYTMPKEVAMAKGGNDSDTSGGDHSSTP